MPIDDPSLALGESFSVALDPHRRRTMTQAIERVFADRSANESADQPAEQHERGDAIDSVALVGWQAATLIDEVYDRVDRVVIVENDDRLVDSIQQGLRAGDLGKKVELLETEPRSASLESPVDLAVTSVSSTWFIEGTDAQLLSQIRDEMLAEDGTMIPRRFIHLLELAAPPNDVGGMPLRAPRFSRPGEPVPTLSESKHFTTTHLEDAAGIPEEVDDTIIVKPLVSGELTALRLTTLCELADGVVQTTSQSGLQSILVPLREDIEIDADCPVNLHIRYEPGSGLGDTKFSARQLPEQGPEEWPYRDHPVTETFQDRVAAMVDDARNRGRSDGLQNVVQYTIEPHGDVSRLTAMFWTLDEEWRKPVRDMVDEFRSTASSELGEVPGDEVVYDLMLEVYEDEFGPLEAAE